MKPTDPFTIALPDYSFHRWRITVDLETMNADDFNSVFKFAKGLPAAANGIHGLRLAAINYTTVSEEGGD